MNSYRGVYYMWQICLISTLLSTILLLSLFHRGLWRAQLCVALLPLICCASTFLYWIVSVVLYGAMVMLASLFKYVTQASRSYLLTYSKAQQLIKSLSHTLMIVSLSNSIYSNLFLTRGRVMSLNPLPG